MFTKGKWIWHNSKEYADEYVNFTDSFVASGKTVLKIACDSNYTAYVNGKLAAFGQYADYPHYKVYDEVDISQFTVCGENKLAVTVWYYGINSQTYKLGAAGLIYELECDGNIVGYSGTHTLSRIAPDYIGGVCHSISGQLGLSYHYDCKGADDWYIKGGEAKSFSLSAEVAGISYDFHKRPIKKLVLRDRMKSRIVMQGTFTYMQPRVNSQTDMQHAGLSFRYFGQGSDGSPDFSSPVNFSYGDGDGIFFIVDCGAETAGFLDFDITVPENTDMEVGYGEHLIDGRCRTSIRDFSADIKLKAGDNSYLNTFRRFGCRYVQFFIHSRQASVRYTGIRPTEYPVNIKKPDFGNVLRDTIYEVCENTLIQCMHEHYEDCPWREQALYTMDSRNQMLCGYYTFSEYEFPRAALRLMSYGMRDDGILALCYPAGLDFPIPSFSLMYFVQMDEYIRYSKDTTLATECYDVLTSLIKTFTDKIDKQSGLCGNFYGQDSHGDYPYWNFYEWSESMSGSFGERNPSVEAPLNADLSLALQSLSSICSALGKDEDAEKYAAIAEKLNKSIQAAFYNKKERLFNSFDNRFSDTYSVLTNSLCLLCGAADGVDTTRILDVLSKNGGEGDGIRIIPNTLSMNSFRFDALLNTDREKYKPIVLNEIDRDYLYMLRGGATSFWETIIGDGDFGGAGSLCHGWSALAAYYYEILRD